jgi:hypothetical protein
MSSIPDEQKFLSLLNSTITTFRNTFKLTKPGLRKLGYRDLSLIDKEDDIKVKKSNYQINNNSFLTNLNNFKI